jgi:dTDP-4-amino-4,6-dideoxygalactose transaminase
MQKAYEEYEFSDNQFPIASLIAETCLSLPLYPGMDDKQINYICQTIKLFYA